MMGKEKSGNRSPDRLAPVVLTLTIPAPIDQVWSFLMNERAMAAWLDASTFKIDIYQGGGFELEPDAEGTVVFGETALLLPEEALAFTWNERRPDNATWFNNLVVTINLEPESGGTRFTLNHDGFKYLAQDEQITVRQKYIEYWQRDSITTRLLDGIAESTAG